MCGKRTDYVSGPIKNSERVARTMTGIRIGEQRHVLTFFAEYFEELDGLRVRCLRILQPSHKQQRRVQRSRIPHRRLVHQPLLIIREGLLAKKAPLDVW